MTKERIPAKTELLDFCPLLRPFSRPASLVRWQDMGQVLHLRKEAAMSTVIRRPRRRLSKEQLRALRRQQAKKARKGRRDLDRNPSATAQAGAGPLRPPGTGVPTTDPSPIRPPGRRCHPDPGRTYHLQPAPLPGRPGTRTSLQLSPDLLPQPLAPLGAGSQIHHHGPQPIRTSRGH